MKLILMQAVVWGAAAVFALQAHSQVLIYGLTSTNSLVVLSDTGGRVLPGPSLAGLGAGENIAAIDFRPFTGELYALSRDTNSVGRLYTVNVSSGALTPVPLGGATLTITGNVDMDFNPAAAAGVNALRVLTSDGQNYRLVFTAAGATVNVDGAVNVSGGAASTNVMATAYTRNVAGLPGGGGAGGTVQYAIDSSTDTLYRVNPPNNGTLTEPKPLGLDVGAVGGLDIVTGSDRAMAVFTVAGATGLYQIDLTTGAATLLRELPGNVVNVAAALPTTLPGTLVYGLTSTNSLVVLNTVSTTTLQGPVLTGLGNGESAVSLDFRPLNGALYVLTRDAANLGRLYTVDVVTGAATPVALSGSMLTVTGTVDIDFNPAANAGANALRIVTSDEQNYRLVFTADGATVNTDGSVNAPGGATANTLIGTGYANNSAGLPGGGGAGGTTQYAIDSETDTLYRVNPPNNGTLTEPKPLPLDISGVGGLDILTGSDRALAAFTVNGAKGLFEINVGTGTTTLVRPLPDHVVSIAAVLPAVFPRTLVYGLTPTNSLISFTTDGSVITQGPVITGLGSSETVVGIDFRPLNGQLYALSRDTNGVGRLFTVALPSGQATAVALAGPELILSDSVGIDFNPAANGGVNALRVLTGTGLNYRLVFTAEGATVNVDGAVNVTGGAAGTNVIATAYANNRAGLPGGAGVGGTTQYALDSATDTLYRVNPPNNGTLTERRQIQFDIGGAGGLDIVSGSDRALAVLEVGGGVGLYELNLTNGVAGLVRPLPNHVVDLAVPMPITITGITRTEAGATLNWVGGVGPYSVQRAEVVTDPMLNIFTVTTQTATVTTEGATGFFRIVDLVNTP